MAASMQRRVLSIVIALLLAGCSSINRPGIVRSSIDGVSRNSHNKNSNGEKKYTLTLAVAPLAEKRGNLKSYGSVYKYLLPLVPYGTIRYERPDQAKMFNTPHEFEFNMSENLVKLLVDAVKKSALFDNVILTPTPLESNADLILSGDIYSTIYEGKTYSYGLSFLGPALWCLGLPAGSSYKKLTIELYVKRKDTGEQLWSYDINKEKTVVQGLYHNWGKDVNSFAALMEEGVKGAISDMRLKLSPIVSAFTHPLKSTAQFTPPAQPVQSEQVDQSVKLALPSAQEAESAPSALPAQPVQPAPSSQPAVESLPETVPAVSAVTDK